MWIVKFGICILTISFAIYFYINAHNRLIEMQLAIPPLQKKMREILADNDRLQFEIDRFESPKHLMELAERPEFSHLKPSYTRDILVVPQ